MSRSKKTQWVATSSYYAQCHLGRMPMVSIFGRHTLIINNYEDAVELLDSRSAIYSDRPAIPMAEMVGWQNSTTLAKYGAERLRVGRKLFHRTMGMPAAVKTYHPVQEEETFRFIKRLVADPENLRHLIRMWVLYVIPIFPTKYIDLWLGPRVQSFWESRMGIELKRKMTPSSLWRRKPPLNLAKL